MRRANGFRPVLVGPGEQDGENGERARRTAALLVPRLARAISFPFSGLERSRRTGQRPRSTATGPNFEAGRAGAR